ncbi:MAG: secondary thiamine-phosphate synthase enzyme YjbQ [Proteobacteria bacterium]|nr:secondary thiamine-phosphate synthase enzyme YjbQ [Pseudomonadota bacterium]
MKASAALSFHAASLTFETPGRGTYDISERVQQVVREARIAQGICNLFVQHTSASLIVCENADPAVRGDLERFLARVVPDGDPLFSHVAEGADDMPAHIRSVLTATSLCMPVESGRCALGTWQGIYLFEHRFHGHGRRVQVSVMGIAIQS